MFTENYKYSDYNDSTEGLAFENAPVNLITDKQKSYLYKSGLKSKLSCTHTKDAKVEYFLSKWRTNEKGCIVKVMQSEGFFL